MSRTGPSGLPPVPRCNRCADAEWVRFPGGQVVGWPRSVCSASQMAEALTALVGGGVVRVGMPATGGVWVLGHTDATAAYRAAATARAEDLETAARVSQHRAEFLRRQIGA